MKHEGVAYSSVLKEEGVKSRKRRRRRMIREEDNA